MDGVLVFIGWVFGIGVVVIIRMLWVSDVMGVSIL